MSQPSKPTLVINSGEFARADTTHNPDQQGDTDNLNLLGGGSDIPSPDQAKDLSFGDFEVVSEIGRGGMGVVYQARQMSLDRPVALKVLFKSPVLNQQLLDRFRQEARASASLTHPNIVTIYQLGDCPAGYYIAMEYIEGQTLDSILEKRTVPIAWAVNVMIAVADAVHFAHSKNIIHRDLKPGNIMIDKNGRAVVMDFGIAKVTTNACAMTQAGEIIGTPSYMSPEQAGDPTAKLGPHSDVYSLGAVLYVMLTGRVPFKESTAIRTIMKVVSQETPPAVCELRPGIPPALEQICMKCLNKRPAERFPTGKELGDALRRFKSGYTNKSDPTIRKPPAFAVILEVNQTGKQLRLVKPRTIIGRASDCDLVLRVSDVSKQHCQILIEQDQVILEDMQSTNGTSLNDRFVRRSPLKNGDVIAIAEHKFIVRIKPIEAT